MRKHIVALILISLVSNASMAATEGENQAHSFANIYASLCLKHLNNLDALREKLKPMPKLPPEKAAHFLAGKASEKRASANRCQRPNPDLGLRMVRPERGAQDAVHSDNRAI